MASQIDICNWALSKIGQGDVAALTDQNPRARSLTQLWDLCRDDELRKNRWRFSMVRTALAKDAAAPVWGYASQYTLPGDCLRVVQVSEYDLGRSLGYATDTRPEWVIEGDRILTDLPRGAALNIRYIARVTEAGRWDPSFVNVMACRLGLELCDRLTESGPRKAMAMEDYRMAMREARRAEAIEHPPQPLADTDPVAARLLV